MDSPAMLIRQVDHSMSWHHQRYDSTGPWYVTCHLVLGEPFPILHWPMDFCTEDGTYFIAKSCKNGKDFFLDKPLSKMTTLGHSYIASHVVLNNWLVLVLGFSFSGCLVISNQPVAGSLKVITIMVQSLLLLSITMYSPILGLHTRFPIVSWDHFQLAL